MIAANRWDRTAKACAARWGTDCAGVLTAQDLSTAGWRQRLGQFERGTVVVGGKILPHADITGVLTLLPSVTEQDLVDIVPEDRAYVASEMTAFLVFWLSSLICPVLNRPTPMCLSGPHWRREQWVSAAARAGIPVQSFRRRAAHGSDAVQEALPDSTIVTVAGRSIIGEADPELLLHAQRLAGIAGVQLLAVNFSSPRRNARFVTASTFPDLSDDRTVEAVLECLRTRPVRCS